VAEFRNQDLRDSIFDRVDLTGARITSARLHNITMKGVELVDVTIHGDVVNVVVNGVDIAPLIEAELDRRHPLRVKMRPTDPAGFREAWTILEGLWDETVQRAQNLSPNALHESVNGEWSFIQTLRHLNFASAAWVARMVTGVASPWHPLDLPWDEAPGWDGIPWDREARPSLDEVLVVRRERQAMVRGVVDALTDEQLASNVTQMEPGWPQIEDFPLRHCLGIVLNEEWEHRLYAERDLAALESGPA
jgi:hypothetical protein